MEALFREEKARSTALLGPLVGKVGAYEGALYESTGYYRPEADCIMFTRDDVGFCAVCRRAIEATIDRYAPRPRRAMRIVARARAVRWRRPPPARRRSRARSWCWRPALAPLPGQVAEAAPPRFVLLEDGQVFVGGTPRRWSRRAWRAGS